MNRNESSNENLLSCVACLLSLGNKEVNRVLYIALVVWILLMLYGIFDINPYPIIIAIFIMMLIPVLQILS